MFGNSHNIQTLTNFDLIMNIEQFTNHQGEPMRLDQGDLSQQLDSGNHHSYNSLEGSTGRKENTQFSYSS